ncbi:MAG: hypothetical protein IKC36_03465 [Clostridia bacterium]|nr:hypothetical protein [Clostridia bacterium]
MSYNLRRVHLDFHTSEKIEGIGEKFNSEEFKEALRVGHVTSITLFAKCHHGYTYYPSSVCEMHPHLKFDLLKAEVDAAHEIGVSAPIYLPVGWSAKDAEDHPEWLSRDFNTGEIYYYRYDPNAKPTDIKPMCSWKVLCPVGDYKKQLIALTKEICTKFAPIDGVFYDICFLGDACGCDACKRGMSVRGYDPTSFDDAKKYYIETRQELIKELVEIVKSHNKNATVFFNGGAEINYPMYHDYQSHFELEDLPSAWGGYDRLPVRAKFFTQKQKKQTIGMTGKFHLSWGEFGGFKRTEALKYECSNMLALGAGCSIGDQLHPSGKMDMETYRRIGQVYQYIEQIEEYCANMSEVTEFGFVMSQDTTENEGVSKMLMESQRGFVLVLEDTDISRLKCILVPNHPQMSEGLVEKLKEFHGNGGKLLLIGDAVSSFENLGIKYIGHSEYDMDYISTRSDIMNLNTPLLAYSSAYVVSAGEEYQIIADVFEPYFSRTYESYCSHRNTPYRTEKAEYPAAITNGKVAYIAHNIPQMYYDYGSSYHRDYFIGILKTLLDEDVCAVSGLMSCGRMRFVENDDYYALHLFYASPISRGEACVIEDIPEIYNISVKLRLECEVEDIIKIPQKESVEYTKTEDGIAFTVDKIKNHQLIVLKKKRV